jgi:hypothetical protein
MLHQTKRVSTITSACVQSLYVVHNKRTYRDEANSAVVFCTPHRLCDDTSDTFNKCTSHVTRPILETFNKVTLLTTLLSCCLCQVQLLQQLLFVQCYCRRACVQCVVVHCTVCSCIAISSGGNCIAQHTTTWVLAYYKQLGCCCYQYHNVGIATIAAITVSIDQNCSLTALCSVTSASSMCYISAGVTHGCYSQ